MDKRKTETMTPEELEGLIARHGARIAVWPAEARAAAEALMARSAAAEALVARQQALDALFDSMPPVAAPAGLQERILTAVARAGKVASLPLPAAARPSLTDRLLGGLHGLWPQAIGFAAASLLGFMIGTTDPTLLPLEEHTDLSAYIVGYEDEVFTAAIIEEIQP